MQGVVYVWINSYTLWHFSISEFFLQSHSQTRSGAKVRSQGSPLC